MRRLRITFWPVSSKVTVRTPTGYGPNFAGSGVAVSDAGAKGSFST